MSMDYQLLAFSIYLVLGSVSELDEKICEFVHLVKIFAEMLLFI
jgi:hypothetical protein